MLILAIDPGKTCGWAFLDMENERAESGGISLDLFPAWLAACASPVTDLVCEDFTILPHMARKQDPKASAAIGIGVVRAFAASRALRLHMVAPGVKSAGEAWGRRTNDALIRDERRAAKSEHERDALDLASYWARQACLKGVR